MITAAESFKKTQDVIGQGVTEAEDKAMLKINEAIQRGDYSTMISLGNTPATVQAALRQSLADAGYDVTDNVALDQRDYGYITVSWLTQPDVTE